MSLRSAAVPLPLLLAACADAGMMSAADMGVTPGGSQDIAFARELIEQGAIPRDEHFTAEGLFSEHDLPLPEEACDDTLCARAAAMPHSPVDGSGEQVLVQLGFATNITSATFERNPLNVAVAVDISGSMSGNMEHVKHALRAMVEQLDEGDEVALVAFDDTASVLVSRRAMDEDGRAAMERAIDGLGPRGGTDIEAGLQLAYGEVAPDAGREGIEDRVMLFTDAQPNVGATDMGSFLGMARYYAESDIGISAFGVGLDFGSELADAISKTRGGNTFYLATQQDIRQVFDTEFDLIVSPIAYDLAVKVSPASGLAFVDAFGAPMDSGSTSLELGASTLFLSARDGGMGASLSGAVIEPGMELATFGLSWEDLEGRAHTGDVTVAWEGGSEYGEADALGVYKMAGLVDEFLALEAGAAFCDGELRQGRAEERIAGAIEHLEALASELADVPLGEEATLMEKLALNLASGTSACADEDAYVY